MRLSDTARALFLSVSVERRHSLGETIIGEQEEDGRVFLMLEGRAEVLIHAPDGKLVNYSTAKPGDLVGILTAIAGGSRSASVVACGAGRTASVSVTAFRTLMDRPTFAHEVQVHLVAKIRELSDRIFEFGTLLVRDRLVRELLRQVDAAASVGQPLRIDPAPTHFALAARIATHREAVSREMSRLAQLGVLVRKGKSLVVPSRADLEGVLHKTFD